MTDKAKTQEKNAGILRILGVIIGALILLESFLFLTDDGRFFLTWYRLILFGVFFGLSAAGIIAGCRWKLWGGITLLVPVVAYLVIALYDDIRFSSYKFSIFSLTFFLPSIIAAVLFIIAWRLHRESRGTLKAETVSA
jgi:hypothetical protein